MKNKTIKKKKVIKKNGLADGGVPTSVREMTFKNNEVVLNDIYNNFKALNKGSKNTLQNIDVAPVATTKNQNLNDINGSVSLAQNQEDEFLNRIQTNDGTNDPTTNDKIYNSVSQLPVIGQFAQLGKQGQDLVRGDGTNKTRVAIAEQLTPHKSVVNNLESGNFGRAALAAVVPFGLGANINSRQGYKQGGKVKGYQQGGEIVGKGTAKSDSIDANLKNGSFVVPAENSHLAELIRKEVLGDRPNKKATLKKGGEVNVKVSNGEHVFNPKEVALITKAGIDLNALAPNSKGGNKLGKGGFSTSKDTINVNNPVQRNYYNSLAEKNKILNDEILIKEKSKELSDYYFKQITDLEERLKYSQDLFNKNNINPNSGYERSDIPSTYTRKKTIESLKNEIKILKEKEVEAKNINNWKVIDGNVKYRPLDRKSVV